MLFAVAASSGGLLLLLLLLLLLVWVCCAVSFSSSLRCVDPKGVTRGIDVDVDVCVFVFVFECVVVFVVRSCVPQCNTRTMFIHLPDTESKLLLAAKVLVLYE